ncbi:MAG: RNA 3'-terminal phosphate cyclase [Candidatus Bathyarchaeota archaeon]|nr:RNA 3'-terminal phosphate cyclase [Candidatus Bathyarchaeota archaeon]
MIDVDGSMMEGGGQLLRMATTYSAILGEPITVKNIRASRGNPGLRPQHLSTLKSVAELCHAETTGLEIGSPRIEFHPNEIHGGSYSFNIGTAGGVSLLLQCVAPVAAFADSPISLRVIGGTAVRWSPPLPVVDNVVWRGLRRMGFKGGFKVVREGFYPRGGGIVEANIDPIRNLVSFEENSEKTSTVSGVSTSYGLPRHVSERQAESAHRTLTEAGIPSNIKVKAFDDQDSSYSPGSYVCLWGEGEPLIGADALGERGKLAESVGSEAAGKIIREIASNSFVDQHTADNLILPCSLASGESQFTVSLLTLHTLTAVEIARSILNIEISVEGREKQKGRIIIKGAGIKNPNISL